jgi:hypothetical protein
MNVLGKSFGFRQAPAPVENEAKAWANFLEKLKELELYLEGKQYIAETDHPTIADIYIYEEVTLAVRTCGVGLGALYNVKSWYERIQAIEKVKEIDDKGYAEYAKFGAIEDEDTYRFIYWSTRGIGSVLRYMLEISGVKYVEDRITNYN